MKKLYALTLIFSWLVTPFLFSQPTGVIKKKLFEIGAGETPVYSECRILFNSAQSGVALVTINEASSNYFLYSGGKKTGPFKDISDIKWEKEEDSNDLYSSIFTDYPETDVNKFLSMADNGYQINANGKKYGPFQVVVNVFSDTEGTFRSAITMKDMTANLITEKGTIVPLPGMPENNIVSPSGKKVIVVSTSEYNPASDMANIDFSKMTQEQLMKLSKEIEAKQNAAPKPQSFLFFNDGTRLGPYPKDELSGNNPAFSKTGGENWFMKIGSKLYVNGKELADLGNESISNDDIWISEDGKRYAVTTYDKIFFSDGSSFDYPLKIERKTDPGKTIFTWVSLENAKDIVLYSKNL